MTMLAGPEDLGSYTLSILQLLVRRESLYCHLWFLQQLWVTKEIKYFVPQQKPGFECFTVA